MPPSASEALTYHVPTRQTSEMSEERVVALRENNGRVHLLRISDKERKVKGIGRINPMRDLGDVELGSTVNIQQKEFLVVRPRMNDLLSGMARRAQIITPKDASLICSLLGLTAGDRVLELGFGSAGLSLHIANIIQDGGILVSVEKRDDHSAVGVENMSMAEECLSSFPQFNLVMGDAYDAATAETVAGHCEEYDAVTIDLPEPWKSIPLFAPMLAIGGRISCYCPITSQMEACWVALEEAGLTVEWAGERIDRVWSRASRGGVRPSNNPMGHTACIVVSTRSR